MDLKQEKSGKGRIFFNEEAFEVLEEFLFEKKPSKVFLLVDSNTHNFCLPDFLASLKALKDPEIIEIEAGEQHKNLETCAGVWNALSELGADRKSLLINIGGGVVTDLGGFVASTFKRGIQFINVPTSLLAMVDAAIGGKNGVGLGNLKNQIGVVNLPEFVMVNTNFLDTLPRNEMRSGLAEIWKHGLIKDESYWKKTTSLTNMKSEDLDDIIKESIDIKLGIVKTDPEENNLRKTLNFGHTLGHAMESYFLGNAKKPNILHGEAVAAGMIMATYISSELLGFPKQKLEEIKNTISAMFEKIIFDENDEKEIIKLLKFDKKTENGNINFVLLKDIGVPAIDCHVPNELIFKSFEYYLSH